MSSSCPPACRLSGGRLAHTGEKGHLEGKMLWFACYLAEAAEVEDRSSLQNGECCSTLTGEKKKENSCRALTSKGHRPFWVWIEHLLRHFSETERQQQGHIDLLGFCIHRQQTSSQLGKPAGVLCGLHVCRLVPVDLWSGTKWKSSRSLLITGHKRAAVIK